MAEVYGDRAPETSDAAPATPALIVSWLVVGLPLAWGIYQTVQKSLALFK